jgi:uncharacterized protein
MTTFVDTSALYALLDEADASHQAASAWLSGPGADPAEILGTHSYVVVESIALVKTRLGATAVRVLLDAFLPALSVMYVDEALHLAGITGFRAAATRGPSFVDHVSFEFMRDRGIQRAFAFDADFRREGFELVPR